MPMMKAAVLAHQNDEFKITDLPRPVAGDGTVLVRIQASSVNPLDTKIRSGNAAHARHPLPGILGIDMVGTVVEPGTNVAGFKPGDIVYGMTGGVGGLQGALAQYAAVDARLLALVPDTFSIREAAALPLAFITAWEGLVDRVKLQGPKKVLVIGGGGAVGQMAIQIARARGAIVYAVDSAKKGPVIESLGATFINYEHHTVADYVATHTDNTGFDVVYDTIGGPGLDAAFQAVSEFGHVASCLGWGTHALAPLSFKGASYSGVFTLTPLLANQRRQRHGDIMAEATRMANAGQLKLQIDPREFTLETVNDAYFALESGNVNGKLIITIA
ncbi:zinc-dependent alcohol dehydrogenase family protein [Thalassospira marina]|uniref:Quinone oxidoreductase n=1 Tax=Thalassospira marina TaxID=2048283 RepID=A0ABM6Q7V6_9PROT|nr:zinc-dependent alcohol dehydrogenase family protein [Thalassospira marina]AUG52556.1 quinone oxidoreductase [Thalassospira marina]